MGLAQGLPLLLGVKLITSEPRVSVFSFPFSLPA